MGNGAVSRIISMLDEMESRGSSAKTKQGGGAPLSLRAKKASFVAERKAIIMAEAVPEFSSQEEEMKYWQAQMRNISDVRSQARGALTQQIEKEQQKRADTYSFFAVPGTISIYVSVAEYLCLRGGWSRSDSRKGVDLLLAAHTNRGKTKGMSAGGVSFSCLTEASGASGKRVLVNCYRGFETACSKVEQVCSLKRYCEANGTDPCAIMPESYVFNSMRIAEGDQAPDDLALRKRALHVAERKLFVAAHARHEGKAGCKNVWIVKPSEGSCGNDIVIERELPKLLQTIADMSAMGPLVVQKYIERPLTVVGGRKFDIRAWVLVTADYRIGIYREGVLRTTATPYDASLSDLSNRFAHLSNHCIAVQHGGYGDYEPTNEMWWGDFDSWLIEKYGEERGFYKHIYPQMKKVIVASLLAVKDRMETTDTSSFRSFHLFGYDLMVDADFDVCLLEVNSSPAVAADLMAGMTEDLVHVAIDPLHPIKDSCTQASAPALAEKAARAAAKYLTTSQTIAQSSEAASSKTDATAAASTKHEHDDNNDAEVSAAAASSHAADATKLADDAAPMVFLRGFDMIYDPKSGK